MYILKSHHGRKLGRAFLAAAARYWLSQGGLNLIVMFMRDNCGAERFYRSMGGFEVYQGTFELGGMTFPDKAMVFNDLQALAALGA